MLFHANGCETHCRDAHVAEPDVLCANLLVDAAGKDDALTEELGQDVRDGDALGQVDGRHGVGLILRLSRDYLEAHVRDGLLDPVRDLDVLAEALGQGLGQDLLEGRVEGVDELG